MKTCKWAFSFKVYVTNVYFAMHNCWNVYLLLLIWKIKIQQLSFSPLICQLPWFNIWNNCILKWSDAGQENWYKRVYKKRYWTYYISPGFSAYGHIYHYCLLFFERVCLYGHNRLLFEWRHQFERYSVCNWSDRRYL